MAELDIDKIAKEAAEKGLEYLKEQGWVQVVRCKECKWFRTPDKKHDHSYCYRLADHSVYISGDTHEDEFCSRAERREEQ